MIEATWLLTGIVVGFFLGLINLRMGLRVGWKLNGGEGDILAVEKKPKAENEEGAEFDQDFVGGPEEINR